MDKIAKIIICFFPNFKLGNQGIAKKLLICILFFSSLITILLSGVQLFIDYRIDLRTIQSRLDEIEKSYKDSLEASLWNIDIKQLNIQIDGIKRLPDIQMVRVEENSDLGNSIILQKGNSEGNSIKKKYDLLKINAGETINIGTLYIEVSLTELYQHLINQAITITLIQGIKTFFVSFFILFLFYRLVTRHIIYIEYFLKNIDFKNPYIPLKLNRNPPSKNDEIDNLVDAYNIMTLNLRVAYNDIRTVNQKLKKDIAARKKAEAEVKNLNEQLENRVQLRTAELEAANKELNSFCYSVSHDLRAPLRRVDGFRKNITASYSDKFDQQGKHYLSRMEACTNEIGAMIDSFLILSKSTNTELLIENINLTNIVHRNIVKLREKEPKNKFIFKIQPNVVANGDARLVELLISNLLNNAWKYSSKNPQASIFFYKKKVQNETVYIIEDNGVGFNMEFAQNLFSPFTRLHKVSDFKGIGIGLATVKRVAARHGGRVWAKSSVGHGAKFFFTLGPNNSSNELTPLTI